MVITGNLSCFSSLVKLLNKSIEGTADDDEEGVTPDTAIRSGLELLKVFSKDTAEGFTFASTTLHTVKCQMGCC